MAKKSRNKKLNKANLRYANTANTANLANADVTDASSEGEVSASVETQADKEAARLRAQQVRKAQLAQQRKDKASKKRQKSGDISKSSRKAHTPEKRPNVLKRIFNYFKAVVGEIKLTTWPTKYEVLNMSLIVVGVLLFFGILIFVLDWLLSSVMVQYADLTDAVNPSSNVDSSATDTGTGDASTDGSDQTDTEEQAPGYANQ